jgi:endoglucanase
MKFPSSLLLLIFLLAAGVSRASDPNDVESFPRLRGVTTSFKADAKVFTDIAAEGANAVRLILSPVTTSASNPAVGWRKMIANLPAQLDAAKANHLIVIVSLFTPPTDATLGPKAADRKAALHAFWTDPHSLDLMKDQAIETAKLLQPYEGMVWLELKNEPLDWSDFPAIPANWPDWSQKLVDAVRAVSAVPIVVQVGPGSLCSGFSSFPKLKGSNLVYSVHNYLPQECTHQGVNQIVGTDLDHPYDRTGTKWPFVIGGGKGKPWDKERLRKELEPAVRFARENKARIYVGEFGVARWAPGAAAYLKDNIDLFEEFGWDWTYHAFRESHIWSYEYDDQYPDGQGDHLAAEETARAKVVRSFFQLNHPSKERPLP